MPCWRIVFSTFPRRMSFYTGSTHSDLRRPLGWQRAGWKITLLLEGSAEHEARARFRFCLARTMGFIAVLKLTGPRMTFASRKSGRGLTLRPGHLRGVLAHR